ncbi:hypothetical protein BDN71DRAFT_1483024 [Pleurotus eryngii]|uniref:Uncharacterized protein n=1 Tax=Pleurotus eryngii TaxID=5323 RepID=A0A9P6D7Y6_PLEER|nr:hypothetical protein BDN71DRAFT_1483024 [Pleurotus eryngii]
MDNGGRPDGTTDGASNPSEEDPHDNETGGHLEDDTDGAGRDGGQLEDRDNGGVGGVPGGDIGGDSNGAEDGDGDRGAGGPSEDRDSEELLLQETSSIADIDTTLRFIELLRSATLEESGMDPDDIEMLRKPAEYPLQIDDPDLLLGIKIYKACSLASEATYNSTRHAIIEHFPNCKMPTLDQVKRAVKNLSGVKPIVHHMCEKSCLAFTGPFEDLDHCPKCLSPRYTKPGSLEPRKTFSTIPLGPQIQALYCDAVSARKMKYQREKTAKVLTELRTTRGQILEYNDYISGCEYLDAVQAGLIKDNDTVLIKTSDCWIFVWIFLDLDGDCRYKKVYVTPGIVIAGPDKPKNLDSFLFLTFYHVSALQREGLRIWDADLDTVFNSDLFLLFGTADGPGLALHNGLVGHKGRRGCRLHCPITGRHKPGEPTQYLVLMLPDNYTVHGCDHADVDIRTLLGLYSSSTSTARQYRVNLNMLIQSHTNAEFKRLRLQTGICKPCILKGLPKDHTLGVIAMNTLNFMHIPALNIPKLLFLLFRGKIDCEKTDSKNTWDWAVLQGNVWKSHGAEVTDCTPYLPGSFDRPPRNPAEKISSGYKAWEFLIYIYSLGPALFYGILPEKYWKNLCLLIQGIRILLQRKITRKQLCYAHMCLIEFITHIHILAHGAPETIRIGPAANVSQWTMERTIGNLGKEIRLHSNPYQNLTQRSIYRAQMNALQAMLGQGYILLHATDGCSHELPPSEHMALSTYMCQKGIQGTIDQVVRWARLALPNGQIARSRWKELQSKETQRVFRQVKFYANSTVKVQFGEVFYYFYLTVNGHRQGLCMLSVHSPPDEDLLKLSAYTLYSCKPGGEESMTVIEINTIDSVVAVLPHLVSSIHMHPELEGCVYIAEKPGLDIARMAGFEDLD